MADVAIRGVEGMSLAEIQKEVQEGAKFVLFQYCISIGIMTFRRSSDVYFLRVEDSTFKKGLKYTLMTLILGWWGIPWGLIYTPTILFKNLSGGKNVTDNVMQHFHESIEMSMEVAEEV